MADAGRVIAGTARGTRLAAPGPATRPLADRVKQTLFAILEPDLPGAAVLDLFAGSGAGGIEALSRGASRAVFVERDRRAVAAIEENLRRAGLAGEPAVVIRRDVIDWLAAPGESAAAGPFDIVLADPPYADRSTLLRAVELVSPLVAPGAWIVVKHFWRDAPPSRVGLLASERVRRFGETALTFYRRPAGPASEEADER
jgi:16S rRNA (guanine966-N2)-methyltransferase